MTDQREDGSDRREGAYDQATLREWARKMWLRGTMRADALSPEELRLLDERLTRWKADQQHVGKLPPDWQLEALRPAVEREFRTGRDEARPFFTPDEQRAVDASRAAVALRDRIDAREDHGPAVSRLATHHMVTNGVGALDARKDISDRFAALYGRSVADYAREQRRIMPDRVAERRERLFPPELGWERYEPACRRLAEHEALLYLAQRTGTLTNRQYHERKKYVDRWTTEQQERGCLPTLAEMRKSRTPFTELLLPYKKQFGRQEQQKTLGADGAYWRKVDELAGYLRQEIDETRRYARTLDDYAINAAAAYGKGVDGVKRDIEQRFTLHYLDTPAAYLEARLESDKAKSLESSPERGLSDDERGKGTSGPAQSGRDDHDRER